MANFIEGIFGKLGEKLTLQDVEEFFKETQEETATLEFKSGDITPEKLFKSVAGFLNSEGGLLIIGSPKEREDKVNEHLRVKYAKGELIGASTKANLYINCSLVVTKYHPWCLYLDRP